MGKGGNRSVPRDETSWPLTNDGMRKDFIHSDSREPHIVRHKEILAKYPQIEELYGYDWRPAPIAVLLLVSQLVIAYYQRTWSWGFMLMVAWIYRGASSHALSLMTHELSHNLVLPTPKMNELFGIFLNIGMAVPSSTMFKRYHMEHHMYQGDHVKDVDIPTEWEGIFYEYCSKSSLASSSTFLLCLTTDLRASKRTP